MLSMSYSVIKQSYKTFLTERSIVLLLYVKRMRFSPKKFDVVQFKEAKTRQVLMKDIKPEVFKQLLYYMMSKRLSKY
jgi:hypothetical protein